VNFFLLIFKFQVDGHAPIVPPTASVEFPTSES